MTAANVNARVGNDIEQNGTKTPKSNLVSGGKIEEVLLAKVKTYPKNIDMVNLSVTSTCSVLSHSLNIFGLSKMFFWFPF